MGIEPDAAVGALDLVARLVRATGASTGPVC
jgi:hypothetical protein